MKTELKNIKTIGISDTEFEEENDGVIIVKTFANSKIGLGVSQRYNGDAVLWFGIDEAKQVILALQDAIKDINI